MDGALRSDDARIPRSRDRADDAPPRHLTDREEGLMFDGGARIDHHAARAQHPPGRLEGIDDALLCDSAE
jgi:hypothetical protein